jgi:RNAse (barnase) inhibitor barstar
MASSKKQAPTLLQQCSDPSGPVVIEAESLSAAEADKLIAGLAALKVEARRVDAKGIKNKAELLDALAAAFALPKYFGKNWDALVDCLADMSWLPAQGYVCVLLGADALKAADKASYAGLVTVSRDVARRWAGREGNVFFKLLAVHKS